MSREAHDPFGRGAPPNDRHRRHPRPRFFTMQEVADATHTCKRTVQRWIADGLLPVHRIGTGVVRIAEDDLDAFLARHREI
jgi:excisionase family DNA binding protein